MTFTPTAGGSRAGSVAITDNAPGSPQTEMLTGTGEDFSMTASGTASATVTPGQTATYMLSFAANGGFSGTVALTCSGAPAGVMCTVSPTTVALSGTSAVTATVTVITTAASQMLLPVSPDAPRRINPRLAPLVLCLLAMLLIASLYGSRRDRRLRWAPAVTMGLLLCAGVMLTSCGGGSSGNSGGRGGTGAQAGTYTITVSGSATSGSSTLTHAAKLTLVVQ